MIGCRGLESSRRVREISIETVELGDLSVKDETGVGGACEGNSTVIRQQG
jgi:hypothetical protein